MASIMIGVAGCAQQASGGSAPTGVVLSHTSSGTPTSASATLEEVNQGGSMYHNGSLPSDPMQPESGNKNLDDAELDGYASDVPGHTGQIEFNVFGYIHETGATSYSYSMSIDSDETSFNSSNLSASVTGSSVTTQNALGSSKYGTGIGFKLIIDLGSNGGSGDYDVPVSGDVLAMIITGTATNAIGSTNSTIGYSIVFN